MKWHLAVQVVKRNVCIIKSLQLHIPHSGNNTPIDILTHFSEGSDIINCYILTL